MITKFVKVHETNSAEIDASVLKINNNNESVLVYSYHNFNLHNSNFLKCDENKWVEMYCIIHHISWKDITINREMISIEPVDENSAKILKVNLVEYKGIEVGLVGRGHVLDKNEVISVSDIGKYINFPEMEIVMRSYRVLSEEEIEKYGLK